MHLWQSSFMTIIVYFLAAPGPGKLVILWWGAWDLMSLTRQESDPHMTAIDGYREARRSNWLKIQTWTSRKWRRIYQGPFRGWLNHYYSTTWMTCNFLPFGKCVNALFSNFYRHVCLFQTIQSEKKWTEQGYSKAVKSSNSNLNYGDKGAKWTQYANISGYAFIS